MEDVLYSKAELTKMLSNSVCQINFTKVDGTSRDMTCTCMSYHVPEDKRPTSETPLRYSDETLRVFDIDAQDWRSFRIDGLVYIVKVL